LVFDGSKCFLVVVRSFLGLCFLDGGAVTTGAMTTVGFMSRVGFSRSGECDFFFPFDAGFPLADFLAFATGAVFFALAFPVVELFLVVVFFIVIDFKLRELLNSL